MARDYPQIEWDDRAMEDCRRLVRMAIEEDLGRAYDWTSVLLVPDGAQGSARIVARRAGMIAGLSAVLVVLGEFDAALGADLLLSDGAAVRPGDAVARLHGPARSLLTAERTLLNILGRLSGIATLTKAYVDAVAGTRA